MEANDPHLKAEHHSTVYSFSEARVWRCGVPQNQHLNCFRFMCMGVLSAQIYVHHMHSGAQRSQKKASDLLEPKVRDNRELPGDTWN